MGIWIRSQNKETLVKIDCINVYKNLNLKYVVSGFNSSNSNDDIYWNLGTYSTYEKALKILDMIQQKIIEIDKTRFLGMTETVYKKCVFEMPKDEEVKE